MKNEQTPEVTAEFLESAVQDTADMLEKIGAAETIDTFSAFMLAGYLGNAMRNGYTQRKAETLRQLNELQQRLMTSGKPAQIAKGALIEAFIVGWIGLEKLK
jgi:hypothetical protein